MKCKKCGKDLKKGDLNSFCSERCSNTHSVISKKTYDEATYDQKFELIYGVKKTCHRCKKICDDSIPISIEGDDRQHYFCKPCDKTMRWDDE